MLSVYDEVFYLLTISEVLFWHNLVLTPAFLCKGLGLANFRK